MELFGKYKNKMIEETVKKGFPKVIIDVDEESYNRGYDDGYAQPCRTVVKTPDLYLGHTVKYWEDIGVAWLPLVFILIVFSLLLKRTAKRQKETYNSHIDRVNNINDRIFQNSDKVMEINELNHLEFVKTNALLQQLLEKLDKK